MKKLINFAFNVALFLFGLFVVADIIFFRPYMVEEINEVREIIVDHEIRFPDDVLAQFMHETNFLESNVYKHYNNPSGMHCNPKVDLADGLCHCNSFNRREADGTFCRYESISDGILHYKKWQDRRWDNLMNVYGPKSIPETSNEYLQFLDCYPISNTSKKCYRYAYDKQYTTKIRWVKKALENMRWVPLPKLLSKFL